MLKNVVDVGDRNQLFIHHRWSSNAYGVNLTVNPPVKRERVLWAERPWEEMRLGSFATVLEHEGSIGCGTVPVLGSKEVW